ncbi:MAG: RluA family pseudouridine synthase [Deltaproteobacteria bacterium]|nr:RluA family pseudouridine synthase [Deltaproteobacteria bacterium]
MSELVSIPKHVRIGPAWEGLTVFDAVRRAFPDVTPRDVFRKARQRELFVNGKACVPLGRVRQGDVVTVVLPRPPLPPSRPAQRLDVVVETPAGPFRIVREDEDLLAVSKPAGCASHPALRHSGDTLIDRVRHYLGARPEHAFQPALANRLDLETSGIVLVGKNRAARGRLGRSLQRGQLEKRYLALVGGWTQSSGEIAVPLLRRPDSRTGPERRRVKLQSALTRYRTIARYEHPLRCTLLEIELLTGRTHQIRLHLSQAGHPVAADRRYGDAELNRLLRETTGLGRLFLHAHRVRLNHPTSGEALELTTPLPEDLEAVLRSFAPCDE